MCKIEFFNYASLKMSRGKFSVEEVVDLLDDESSLAEVLHGLDLDHDADSDDGDREEADFVTASGTSELVPITLLRADSIQEEEPAFQDSMLLLDDYLETHDDNTDGQEAAESMEYDPSSPFQAESMEYDPSSPFQAESMECDPNSPKSQGDVCSDYSSSHSNCSEYVRGRGKGSRGRGRGSRGRGRGSRGRVRRSRGRSSGSRGRGRGSRGRGGGGTQNKTGNQADWVWSDAYNEDSSISSPPSFDADYGPSALALSCSTPEDFLRLLFTEELIDKIVHHTNCYTLQQGFHLTFTREDILGYIGINIAMGIADLPEITDYWAKEPILHCPWFPSVMALKRFQAMSRFIHFAEN